MKAYNLFAVAVLSLSVLSAGCATEPDAPPPLAERIENESLDLALVGPPEGFSVEDSGETMVLAREGGGTVTIAADEPSDFGIEVVAQANAQKEVFQDRPEGTFSGAQKLGTQFGEGAYARGSYQDESGARIEETTVFLVHPTANRLLTVTYSYPAADDSGERVRELLEVVGSLEARGGAVSG